MKTCKNKKEEMLNDNLIVETEYVPNQRGYSLPPETDFPEFIPKIRVEVFNQKKNKWERTNYHCELVLDRKKLKTDKKIRIIKKITN